MLICSLLVANFVGDKKQAMNVLSLFKTLSGTALISITSVYALIWLYLLFRYYTGIKNNGQIRKIIVTIFSFMLMGVQQTIIYCYTMDDGEATYPLPQLAIKLFVLTTLFALLLLQSSGFILDGVGKFIKHLSGVYFAILAIDFFNVVFSFPQTYYIVILSGLMVFMIMALVVIFSSICVKRYEFIKESIKKESCISAFVIVGVGLLASYAVFISALVKEDIFVGFLSIILLLGVHLMFIYGRCKDMKSSGVCRSYMTLEEEQIEILNNSVLEEKNTDYNNVINRLILYFESEKPYLDSDLKLADVSRRIYTNKTYVSRALNHGMSKNFNQFVNYYRVREACGIFILDPMNSIAELCDKSGFKNLSSFSTAFNLHIGYTPAEWCKEVKRKINNGEHVSVQDYFS